MPADAVNPAPLLRVGFAGTPEFAAQALQAILKAGFQVDVVLSQPDRPSGRGMKLKPSPVKALALEHNIPVLQPQSLKKGQEADQALATLQSAAHGKPIDVLVVAAYGLILPQKVLDAPRLGCLNIHGSLLPRWRGAAPIQRAIQAGDAQTGICIMQMEAGLDTGPVGLTQSLKIEPQDTASTLHDKLAALGGQSIVQALHQLEQGQLHFQVQAEQGVTYADKILKSEGQIDWSESALVLHRKLRAFDPFPGCSSAFGPTPIKCFDPDFLSVPINSGQVAEVLSISADGVVVQTGEGALLVRTLQKAGAKRAPAQQVAQSLGLQCGHILG